jgi:hypothetical protein
MDDGVGEVFMSGKMAAENPLGDLLMKAGKFFNEECPGLDHVPSLYQPSEDRLNQ